MQIAFSLILGKAAWAPTKNGFIQFKEFTFKKYGISP